MHFCKCCSVPLHHFTFKVWLIFFWVKLRQLPFKTYVLFSTLRVYIVLLQWTEYVPSWAVCSGYQRPKWSTYCQLFMRICWARRTPRLCECIHRIMPQYQYLFSCRCANLGTILLGVLIVNCTIQRGTCLFENSMRSLYI